jgi:hypothetical protein
MYDLVTSSLLFFVLVPGVLVTLPPGASIGVSALVHAIVFYVVQAFLSRYIPWWGIWIAAVAAGVMAFYSRPAATTMY